MAEIPSFDGVLRQRRMIHTFEWPTTGKRTALYRPVPWMGLIYFAIFELAVMAIDNFIPVVAMLDAIPQIPTVTAYLLCYLVIPVGAVWLAMNAEIDGRAPHWWIFSFARYLRRPKRTISGMKIRAEGSKTVYRGRVKVWWDLNSPRLRHGWIVGGKVSSSRPARFTHSFRHKHPVMGAHEDGSLVHEYEVPGRIEVRP